MITKFQIMTHVIRKTVKSGYLMTHVIPRTIMQLTVTQISNRDTSYENNMYAIQSN